MLIPSASASQEIANLEGSEVGSAGATVYTQPDNKGKAYDNLPAGTSVRMLDVNTDGSWLLIEYYGPGTTQLRSAYIKSTDIIKSGSLTPSPKQDSTEGNIGFVLCESLSIRERPEFQAPIVATMMYQSTLTILGESDSWYHIRYAGMERTVEGWIRSEYVIKNPQYYIARGETPAYSHNAPNAKRVGLIDTGAQLVIIDEIEGYYIVSLRGASAFIKK